MSAKPLAALAAAMTLIVVVALSPAGAILAREMQDVFVINFPDPQNVKGTVSVEGPIRNATLVSVADIVVSPVKPTDTQRLVPAGTLVTDGYPYAVLSLAGQVKGEAGKIGSVGAILLPDEDPVRRAFTENGETLFPLKVAADGAGAGSYFASRSVRSTVAFPRYQIYLYNTTDKTVSATLYAYLTGN